ncbi:hypothetical protein D3C77_81140 [compost metagenome]
MVQLLQHVAAYQVAAEGIGVQRVEVVLEEHAQVLLLKLLQAPLRPEESFEVFQRGILASGPERVTIGQTLMVETVDLAVPALFQLAQGSNHQHLGGLVGELAGLLVERLGQAGGDTLQVGNRVGAAQRKALQHGFQCSFARVGAVVHGFAVVVDRTDRTQGFFIVGRSISLGSEQLRQAGECPADRHCLERTVRRLFRAACGLNLGHRQRRIDHRIVAQGLQQAAYRCTRPGHLFQHRDAMAQVAKIDNRNLVQCPSPTVHIVGVVQGSNALAQHLAVMLGEIQPLAFAEYPLIDHCQLDEVTATRLEVCLVAFGREQRSQHQAFSFTDRGHLVDDVEGRTHFAAQVQRRLQACMRLALEGKIDPLGHGALAQGLLHLGDLFVVLRQVGVGIFQRVVEVTHQVGLYLPLPRIGALPLPGGPLFDNGRLAVATIFDHTVHTQRCQLLIAARRRRIDCVQGAAGNGW